MSSKVKPYKAIVFGGTGECGQYVMKHLLKSKSCEKILMVNRRVVAKYKDEENVEQIVWKDFNDYLKDEDDDELIDQFVDYDICFSCLGTTGSRSANSSLYSFFIEFQIEEYEDVTLNFGIQIGRLMNLSKVPYHYFISSVGASYFRLFEYMDMKGKVEDYLSEKCPNFVGVGNCRPSMLVFSKGGAKKEEIEKSGNGIWALFHFFGMSNMDIHCEEVGLGMIRHFEEKWAKKEKFDMIIDTATLKKYAYLQEKDETK